VNRWCKHLAAVSDGRLRGARGAHWYINYFTYLSSDAGRTDGRLRDFIFCAMHSLCIALDRQKVDFLHKQKWRCTVCLVFCMRRSAF